MIVREGNKPPMRVPLIYDGVSGQPAHIRRPQHLQESENILTSVVVGAEQRPPTWIAAHVPSDPVLGPLPAGNNQLHPWIRDESESFLFILNRTSTAAQIQGWHRQSGLFATFSISANAQAYLNGANPDNIGVRARIDRLLVFNSDQPVAASDTEGAITAISAANPAVVTSAAHGLSTGDTAVITDSDSTPSIDGAYEITVLSANTFSIDVEVTTPGTTGKWTNAKFDSTTMPMRMTRDGVYRTGTITANTAANPTSVTTSAAHGLASGQTIIITGSNSTPSLNGERVVTVTSPTTFTVPVNVTVAGSAGSFQARPHFTIEEEVWGQRQSGGALTNPVPQFWQQGAKIADLFFFRNRLFFVGDEWAVGSCTGSNDAFFAFFVKDITAQDEADPVIVRASSDHFNSIRHAIVLRKSVLIFCKSGRQFELTAGDALTPTDNRITQITGYDTLPARPAVLDTSVFFPVLKGTEAGIMELAYDEVALPSQARDITRHVPRLIDLQQFDPASNLPSTVRAMEAVPELGMVLIMRRDQLIAGQVFSKRVWVYTQTYDGDQQVQQAWQPMLFEGVTGLHDMARLGPDVFFLAHVVSGGDLEWYLARWTVGGESDFTTWETPTEAP